MPTPPFLLGGGVYMELVSENINEGGETKRHYLPLETRIQLYNEVRRLRKQGLIYKEIIERLYEKYKIRLFASNICCWINGKHNPLGKVNKFINRPSPELSYIIGVICGDGYKCLSGRSYFLKLAVNDKEFVEEFSKCLAKVLGKDKPYKLYWSENLKQWVVEGYSILLYKFLKEKSFEELKTYIEYNKDCVSSFLRALFDGEATIYKRI